MNNVSPKISVICSGIRADKWKKYFSTLSNSKVSFEFIVAGHIKPINNFPSNFKHIQTSVKPAQCVEIAAREARGDLIMLTADDCKLSNGFLDKYYSFYQDNCSEKDIASSLFKRYGNYFTEENYQFWTGIKNSPMLPQSALMKRSLWHKLGGIDKRFIAIMGDIDLTLRVIENGGKVKFCKDVFVEEIMNESFLTRVFNKLQKIFIKRENKKNETLFPEFGKKYDIPTIEKFWVKHISATQNNDYHAIKGQEVLLKKRAEKLQKFKNKGLLEFSQGPKGRWK